MRKCSNVTCVYGKLEIQKSKNIRRHAGVRFLGALGLLFALWVGVAGFSSSLTFAQTSPCAAELPTDFVVGRTAGEVVPITEARVFSGRIIVKNRSVLAIYNTDNVHINGDVLVCDSSLFRVERSVVNVNMSFFLERQFRGFNGAAFQFIDSFFINEGRLTASLNLTNSSLTMEFVNRTDRRRSDLANKVFAWTISLQDSSVADISDTYYHGEVVGLVSNSALRFIRSEGLILWVNITQPDSGGTISPPSTEGTPISWQFDRTTPGFQGAQYSITIENSKFISTAVLMFMHNGVPNLDVTITDSSVALGLVFLNHDNVRLGNLRERRYDDFSLPLVSRRLRLQRTRIWSWGIYAWGSDVTVTDSEAGEVYSETISSQRTARVHLLHSKLTGNGGHYTVSNPAQASPPPSIRVTDCDVYSNLTARNGGVVVLESSRMYEDGEGTASGGTLVATDGAVSVLNSVLYPDLKPVLSGTGIIWKASIKPTITFRKDGTRVATFRGDAALVSPTQTFSRYTIDYAPQSNPSARTQIYEDTEPVTGDTLFTWNVPEGQDGGNYIVRLKVYNDADNSYEVTRALRLPDQGGVLPFYTQSNGVEGLKTSGELANGDIVSLVIDPDIRELPVSTEIVSWTKDDKLITEVALAESSVMSVARVFGVSDNAADTDLVIANPGKDVKVDLVLLNPDGTEYDKTGFVVPAGQTHYLLSEIIPDPKATFQGTLRIQSEGPVGIVALKLANDKNNDPKLAMLPVISEGPLSADSATLPYITDGGDTNSQIILMNPTRERLTGRVYFSAPDGSPLYLAIGNMENSEFPYDIAAGGSLVLTTAAKAERPQIGYVYIESTTKGQAVPRANVLFRSAPNNTPVWETGYAAPAPTTRARMFVELSEEIKPSIAIANPNATAVTVTLSLKSSDGLDELKRSNVTIPPNGQLSQPLSQMMDLVLGTLIGTLEITSDQPVQIVGLRRRSNGANGFVVTALPALDMASLSNRERSLFPYVRDGKGYRTQLMMLNTGGAVMSGSITFLLVDGDIQPVDFFSLF